MSYTVRLDYFGSVGIAELKIGDRTEERVLQCLSRDSRISTFDMSEHWKWLPPIVDRLKRTGKITEIESPYPWHRYKVTP